jgi:hypothetical protein
MAASYRSRPMPTCASTTSLPCPTSFGVCSARDGTPVAAHRLPPASGDDVMPDTANQSKDIRRPIYVGQVDEKSLADGNKSDETVELFNDLIESKDEECGRD